MTKFTNSVAVFAMATSVFSAVATTPASAATTPATTTQTAMQAACDAAKPSNTRGVTYFATPNITNTSTETVETSRRTIEEIPGGILISQTPYVFNAGSEHRNGFSTNIHGLFNSTATYSGGKLVQEITEKQVTTFTFGCHVTKTTGGVTELAPPGQQVDAVLSAVQVDESVTRTEEVSAPDVIVTLTAQRVICISPGTKKGVWTNQNGYTGLCGAALYNAVALGGPIPSNSVPGVTRLLPNAPDQETALPESNLYYPQLPNAPEDFLEV